MAEVMDARKYIEDIKRKHMEVFSYGCIFYLSRCPFCQAPVWDQLCRLCHTDSFDPPSNPSPRLRMGQYFKALEMYNWNFTSFFAHSLFSQEELEAYVSPVGAMMNWANTYAGPEPEEIWEWTRGDVPILVPMTFDKNGEYSAIQPMVGDAKYLCPNCEEVHPVHVEIDAYVRYDIQVSSLELVNREVVELDGCPVYCGGCSDEIGDFDDLEAWR